MSTAHSPPAGQDRPAVALIAGPTASGKSDLAVRLALARQRHGRASVVINADSAQVYADLRVLSARPTHDEMHGIPHRLFGTWDGAQACSAAEWAAAARREVAAAHASGALPILVGGTGLYLRTLLDGIAPVPPIDPAVRHAVRALPVSEAHAALLREDPARASALAPGDSARVARSLEVVRSTGKSLTYWQAARAGGIANKISLVPLVLTADREWLNRRCDRRFAAMLDAGAVAEVEALLARDLPHDLPVMCAIGVRDVAAWIRGDLSREEAVSAGQLATRQYAKRQATWFRGQAPAAWHREDAEAASRPAISETIFQNLALT